MKRTRRSLKTFSYNYEWISVCLTFNILCLYNNGNKKTSAFHVESHILMFYVFVGTFLVKIVISMKEELLNNIKNVFSQNIQ